MIPTDTIQSVLWDKREELQQLRFHIKYPETNPSVDRKEVFYNINRRISVLLHEITELEIVLDHIEEANKNEQTNN